MIPGVILVDDSTDDRYLARRVIERGGVAERVVELEDGNQLLELIDDRPRLIREFGESPLPILVLLDVRMPRMTGFEVLEELERRLGNPRAKKPCFIVIMFTSSNSGRDRESALSYPFVRDTLISCSVMP